MKHCSWFSITKFIIFVLLNSLVLSNLFSQDPFYLNYTTEDGLPSNTVYRVLQTKDNLFWFATEKGLCNFDGQSFNLFDLEETLSSSDIIDIFEDKFNRLWINTANGDLAYIRADSIALFTDKLKLGGQGIRHLNHFGNYLSIVPLSMRNKYAAFLVDSLDQVFNQHEILNSKNLYSSLWDNPKGTSALAINCAPYEFKIEFFQTKSLIIDSLIFEGIRSAGNLSYYCDDESYVGMFHSKLFKFKPNFEIQEIETNELDPFVNFSRIQRIDNDLWMSTNGSGVSQLVNFYKDEKFKIKNYFDDLSITSVHKDGFGNLWFSSLEQGVFKKPKEEVQNFKKWKNQSLKSTAIGVFKNEIYTGTGKGDLFKISNGQISKIDSSKENANKYRNTTVDKESLWFISDNKIVRVKEDKIKSWPFACGKSLAINHDTLYVAGCSNLNVYRILENDIELLTSKRGARYTAIAIDSLKRVWLANQDLFKFNQGEVDTVTTNHSSVISGVIDMEILFDTVLCICSSKGLLLKRNDKEVFYSEKEGLASNFCNKLYSTNDEIWYATQNGLNRINLDPINLNLRSIDFYNFNSGLVSSDVLDIWQEGEYLYTAGSKGISKVELQENKQRKPEIYLQEAYVNKSKVLVKNAYKLDFKKNSLRFKFSALYFGGEIQYRYKLKGLENDWNYTKLNELYYPSLPTGKYTLIIEAFVNQIEGENSSSISIPIDINRPFWRNPVFFFVSLFLSALIFAIYAFQKFKNKRQTELLGQQIKEAEQMAMRAQMNPHFIHNSLNSIQDLILSKDERVANKYLSKFSRLMRVIMQNSTDPFISIDKEVEGLQYYIELEALRFDDSFKYSIIIDDEIDSQFDLIPTSMIQLFVENAIWHGLLPNKTNAELIIRFSKNNEKLIVQVIDNGVGINHTMKKKTSTGISNIKDRIRLLNQNQKEQIKLTTIDRSEIDNTTGTIVRLEVPSLEF